MQKATHEPPVSTLNNKIKVKTGVLPEYELICCETRSSRNPEFIVRVTCPILPGGRPLSAEGRPARSKKEARHNAAMKFLETFFNYRYDDESTIAQIDPNSAVEADKIFSEGLDILKKICLKNDLGTPKVEDICVTGPSHAPTFTAECKVADLHIRGSGKYQVEARLQATSRMIQILMGTAPIHEILKSPQFTPSISIHASALKTYSNKIDSLTDRSKESQLPFQGGVNVKRKLDARSPEIPEEKFTIHMKPELAKDLLALLDARRQAAEIHESNNNSVLNANPIHSAADPRNENVAIKQSNTSLNDNDAFDLIGRGVESTSSNMINRNLTRLQTVSQIERALGNLEKELHDKILNGLVYSDLSHQQTIAIFSQEYEVFIRKDSPPQIFGGETECTDQSIRVACLTKLLMGLKAHIEINQGKLIK